VLRPSVTTISPYQICLYFLTAEEIRDDGEMLIHFDGWTSRYDFWTKPDSPDLHPVGFMANPKNSHSGTRQLQAPKGTYTSV
jgi:hypothetical protein